MNGKSLKWWSARRLGLRAAERAAALLPAPGGIILTYHSVASDPSPVTVRPEVFRRQMELLQQSRFHVVRMSELAEEYERSSRSVQDLAAITFDDGFVDFHEHALPVLAELDLPATVFAVAGRAGQSSDWAKGDAVPHGKLMDRDRLRECAERGIEIGSHSVDHPFLSRLPSGQVRMQVRDSKRVLEDALGRPIKSFCYPYGDWNADVAAEAASAGYSSAVTCRYDYVVPGDDLFRLPRLGMNRINAHDDEAQVQYMHTILAGGAKLYNCAKRMSGRGRKAAERQAV